MKKNNSGITLTSLIITIIVLLILASIAVYSGIETVRSSKLTKFTTEMKIMQLKVNDLYDAYTNNRSVKVDTTEYIGKGQEATESETAKPGIQEIGKDLSTALQDKLNEASSGSGIDITTENGYRYYDAETIKSLEIDGVEGEFFISVPNRQVISVDGFEYDGQKYYTLEQLPDGLYNVEYNKVDGNLSFEVTSEVISGKGKLHVFNISYDKYVNKWQVRYRVKEEDGQEKNTWSITEEFTGSEIDIDVEKLGIYEVQVFHGDEIVSEIKEIELEVRPGLEIGDYVNYTYDAADGGYSLPATQSGYTSDQIIEQTQGLKWRIYSIFEDGTIELIAETITNNSMFFNGSLGYNNGVYLINDICKQQYSNSDLKVEARNMNIKDIEDKMNENGKKVIAEYTSESGVQYGKTKSYGEGQNGYPNIYALENGSGINNEEIKKDGISVNDNGYSKPTQEASSMAEKGLTATQSFYKFSTSTPYGYFDNKDIYDMIFQTKKSYWLASRYVDCEEDGASFGIRGVNKTNLSEWYMFHSKSGDNKSFYFATSLRPIVTIESNINIEPCVNEANGTDEEHMHTIITD